MKKSILALSLSFSFVLISSGQASEIRFLDVMPTAGKTTVNKLKKAKVSGWQCMTVKSSNETGNANKAKNAKQGWYELAAIKEPTQAESDKVDVLLEDGKRAVKCTLKEYDKERKKMANADLESDDDEE